MRIHELSPADAIASVSGAPEGLSSAEALRRLREYGPNRVEKVAREALSLRFFKEFTHLFALILWLAAGLAFWIEWSAPGQGMARVGYAIVGVILVSGVFSFWQEYRAERTLAALRKLLPQKTPVMRGGNVAQLAVEQLVPGDIVLLQQGDRVPADCLLIEAFAVTVNNAALTGESMPQARDARPSRGDDLARATNVLLASTSMMSGRAKTLVFATGPHTEFGRIAHLAQAGGEQTSPLRRELAHLSRMIALLAVAIGVVFFVIGWRIGIAFWKDLIFSIGLIVAMVPEGLLPTLTVALVLATQRMAKRNVLIRYLPAVETLGATTVICTDKTGTLTQNRMAVRRVFLGESLNLQTAIEDRQLVERYRPFFLTAHFCHNLRPIRQGEESAWLGDAMEMALGDMAQQALRRPLPEWEKLDEIPFDSERMRLSTVHATPDGAMLFCKGAPEAVIALCNRAHVAGEIAPFGQALRGQAAAAVEAMAGQGLRVIALAYRPLEPDSQPQRREEELVFAGLAGLDDPPRPEVPEAIEKCRAAGIKVIMVTGDHPGTARTIAREIGLVGENPMLITGENLRHLSDTQLRLALDPPEVIFARAGADQKTRIVDALKYKGHVVAVTGDGVNDAPALRSAHVGIAMGITGTDVAKESADMVLLDDNFVSIVSAVEEGRAVFDNIRKFLTYILAHNVPELVPYLAFALFRIPLPLTPIQILAIDMGTDSLTALGLGVEKPDPQVMRRPPRPQHERLINWPLALRAYLFLGLIEAGAAMAAFFFVLQRGEWQYGQGLAGDHPLYLQATTACLSAIIVMQVVNVFLCRSPTRSVFTVGFLGNPWIVCGVLLAIALIAVIDYTPLGNFIFGTAPIPVEAWLFVLPFAGVMLALEEVRKLLVRRTFRSRSVVDASTGRDDLRT